MKGLLLVLGVLVSAGCSSADESSTPVDDTGASDTQLAADTQVPADTEPGADVSADEVAATKPATPQIVSVMPMAGAWHVTWKLNDTGLSAVELYRSNDGAAPTLVKKFGGTAKDWHDGAATGTVVKYCYTVKTFRGTLESDLSAEKCSK